jgi:FtsH-binding integral membrane protein
MNSNQYNPVNTGARAEIDEGLRNYMNGIYARMAAGVMVTAIVAMAVALSPTLFSLLMGGPQAYIIAFAPIAIVWFGFKPMSMSPAKLQMVFFLIAALYGVSFSTIAVMASSQPGYIFDVARAFFIAVGMFAGASIYGYVTKKDLSGFRQFFVMAIWGIVIAGVVNIFMQSTGFSIIISLVAIPLFAGITVFETQQLKQMYLAYRGQGSLDNIAWSGALTLYISFIAIFMHVLNLFSQR